MQLDDLRLVVWNENNSGRLSEIPFDFYKKALGYFVQGRENLFTIEDRTSDGVYTLFEEVRNIKENIEDIFRIRSRKVLRLAIAQLEGNYIDRDEIRRMIPEEKRMFEQTVDAIDAGRKALLCEDTGIEGPLEACTLPKEHLPAQEGERGAGPGIEPVAVRILHDIEPFMGIDGRTYALHEGDIVTLPRQNAEVLCERNIALNMRLHK